MKKNRLKRIINTTLSPIHIELHRCGTEVYWQNQVDQLTKESNRHNDLKKLWLRQLSLHTVIDIGANIGEFSKLMRLLMPNVIIYAFEPLLDCYATLQAAFADDKLFAAFNVGLGESVGELAFERNEFSPSSSFLKVTRSHTGAFPYTANTTKEVVKVDTLDHAARSLVLTAPLLLKIDVQGFEDRVLHGGEETARMASTILLETSFVELYEQQPLFDDIYMLLKSWGFAYQGSFDQLRDPRTGRTVQEDSVFVRS